MKAAAIILTVCGLIMLAACNDNSANDADQPSAKGPVLMTIWDMQTGEKTLVEAAAIDLTGDNYDAVHLQQPRLRMPVRGGIVYLSAVEATLNNDDADNSDGANDGVNNNAAGNKKSSEEIIEINQEIQIQGEIDGKPINGTAASMRFDKSAHNCDLHNADFIWGTQHVTVKTLHLKSSNTLSGEDWHQEPIGAADGSVGGE